MKRQPSTQLRAILVIVNYPALKPIILPVIDFDTETIFFEELGYGALSGGIKTAVTWIYCIWTDELPPREWGWRDPFEGFGVMDSELQQLILRAMLFRHGRLR